MSEDRRSLDRRVGLPDTRPAAARIERRRTDRRLTPDRRKHAPHSTPVDRDEHRHLVLYLSAHPARLAWLRRFLSSHLERTAVGLAMDGHDDAARDVRQIAARVRTGAADLW